MLWVSSLGKIDGIPTTFSIGFLSQGAHHKYNVASKLRCAVGPQVTRLPHRGFHCIYIVKSPT